VLEYHQRFGNKVLAHENEILGVSPKDIVDLESLPDRYTDRHVLASGGMGTIYRAYDSELERPVAIKVIKLTKTDDEHERMVRKRLAREVQVLSRCKHPNIVEIYGTETLHSGLAIVMEFLDGPSLASLLSEGRLEIASLLEILAAIADGLAVVHRLGVLHRDIKPDNIVIDGKQTPRLIDFGLATFTDGVDFTQLTKTGMLVGTVAYMPPEMLRGKAASPQSDIFQLGVILYYGCTGRLPFSTKDISALTAKSRPDPLAHPAALGLSPSLRNILALTLHCEPKKRIRDGRRLARKLRQAIKHPNMIETGEMDTLPAGGGTRNTQARRNHPRPMLFALLMLATVSIIIWTARPRHEQSMVPQRTHLVQNAIKPPEPKERLHILEQALEAFDKENMWNRYNKDPSARRGKHCKLAFDDLMTREALTREGRWLAKESSSHLIDPRFPLSQRTLWHDMLRQLALIDILLLHCGRDAWFNATPNRCGLVDTHLLSNFPFHRRNPMNGSFLHLSRGDANFMPRTSNASANKTLGLFVLATTAAPERSFQLQFDPSHLTTKGRACLLFTLTTNFDGLMFEVTFNEQGTIPIWELRNSAGWIRLSYIIEFPSGWLRKGDNRVTVRVLPYGADGANAIPVNSRVHFIGLFPESAVSWLKRYKQYVSEVENETEFIAKLRGEAQPHQE